MTFEEAAPHLEEALRYATSPTVRSTLRTLLRQHRTDRGKARAEAARASQGVFFSTPNHDQAAGGPAYRPYSDTQTSLEAAASKANAKVQREEIYQLIAASCAGSGRLEPYGFTADELDRVTGYGGDTIRPRLKDLEQLGRVKQSGVQRRTRKGRMARVWVVVR